MGVSFPNETPAYREARRRLLQHEVALRREMEAVAAEVRSLPPGGEIPEDYQFDHIGADGAPAKVRLSELFRPGTGGDRRRRCQGADRAGGSLRCPPRVAPPEADLGRRQQLQARLSWRG
jgi:hypothetical protein